MPRAKKATLSRKGTSAPTSDDDDSMYGTDMSDAGSDVGAPSSSGVALVLDAVLSSLTEKRSAARVLALGQLADALSRRVEGAFVANSGAALDECVVGCLKRGDADEKVGACRALELMLLTSGALPDGLTTLLRRLAVHGASGEVRQAAMHALSIVVFATCSHDDERIAWLAFFVRFVRRSNATIAVAALDAFGLVATTVPLAWLGATGKERFLPAMSAVLYSSSVEVRSAAGEIIALLYEAEAANAIEDDYDNEKDAFDEDDDGVDDDDDIDETDDDDDIDETDDEQVAVDELDEDDPDIDLDSADVDDVVDMLQSLSTDGTRSRSKKERSRQRAVFRDVLATVEGGFSPKTAMKIGGQAIIMSTWSSFLRLAAMRQMFALGFNRHLADNPVVRRLLSIPGTADVSIVGSILPARGAVVKKGKSKGRYMELKSDRERKAGARVYNIEE